MKFIVCPVLVAQAVIWAIYCGANLEERESEWKAIGPIIMCFLNILALWAFTTLPAS